MRVALPSRGRLRDECLALLAHAGYPSSVFRRSGAWATVQGVEFIEMRPRDAAAALSVGQLDAGFLSTDIVAEHELDGLASTPLGFARSTLVVASRDDDGRKTVADLDDAVVATHLPRIAEKYFAEHHVRVRVLEMGGALEGVCAAGIADAIVDLRETGSSLASNRLRVLDVIRPCEAQFVRRDSGGLDSLVLRVEAVVAARRQRYVMAHLPTDNVDELTEMRFGLAAPTVLPLAGRDDMVAIHFVVGADELWVRLEELRRLGATSIVALAPEAVLA
ncbi:ATP phosphoribosyltransferase [Actinopolymorpha pittospori]|uniref:ATP phosphoribosyltransferase n=1 Tax=Actinopolymorpha pittospori TaxID=648752 RepID=A0A927N1Z9_9ACTN|nr:ATP phosphoribosyltransferase [Actinopolymorpha pittospori]MBE1607452.1 ATP phosphoribosyltransferase [Actinopolymorpha pittospori]